MTPTRGAQRVTITLVPSGDDRSFRHIPSTFSPTNRTYGWRHVDQMDYMLVPVKIARGEIQVDIFLDKLKMEKGTSVKELVENFVNAKLQSDWQGVKLSAISRPTEAEPPSRAYRRATIEEILGASLDS